MALGGLKPLLPLIDCTRCIRQVGPNFFTIESDTAEGGLRVPLVLRYPKTHPSFQRGATLKAFSTVADICPTLLELAGVTHPVRPGESTGDWNGRTVAGMRGKSWISYLSHGQDSMSAIHTEDDPAFGWELFGRAGGHTTLQVYCALLMS